MKVDKLINKEKAPDGGFFLQLLEQHYHKQPNETVTNNRIKQSQTTENLQKMIILFAEINVFL